MASGRGDADLARVRFSDASSSDAVMSPGRRHRQQQQQQQMFPTSGRSPSPTSAAAGSSPEASAGESPGGGDDDEEDLSCELTGQNLRMLRHMLAAADAGTSAPSPAPARGAKSQQPSSQQQQQQQHPTSTTTAGDETDLQRKLNRLDPEKQRYLLRVLESLEREETLVASRDPDSSTRMSVDLTSRAPSSARARTVSFRALSTYGSQQLVGLGKIEVIDDKGQRVQLAPSTITCDRSPVGDNGLRALFTGTPQSSDDKEMFVCRIGQHGPAGRLFQVSFVLPRGVNVTLLRVWNYNSKLRDLNIGVKEAAVLAGSRLIWQGPIMRGSGSASSDSPTCIQIPPSVGANGVTAATAAGDAAHVGKLKAPMPRLPKLKKRAVSGSTPSTPTGPPAAAATAAQQQSPSPSSATASATAGTVTAAARIMRKGSLAVHGRSSSEMHLDVEPVIAPAPVQAPQRGRHGSVSRFSDPPSWLQVGSPLQRQASLDDEELGALSVRGESSSSAASSGTRPRPVASAREGRSRHMPKVRDGYVPSALLDPTKKTIPTQTAVPVSIAAIPLPNATPAATPALSRSPSLGLRRSPTRFVYPSMPSGRVMVISMTTTWGDPYYIGLSGLDIFDEKGKVVKLADVAKQLRADPPDINILEGYEKDPRTIDKILDGVSRTCDDYHVWLAPFTEGKIHTITIEFNTKTIVSLLRFWNYNKSRIHSYRGAREVEVELDGITIFRGEIKKAPGNLFNADACAEYILFSNDDAVLAAIEANDPVPPLSEEAQLEAVPAVRPSTQGGDDSLEEIGSLVGDGSRPMTQACRRLTHTHPTQKVTVQLNPRPEQIAGRVRVKQITFNFVETWGDPYYMGLTGLKLYDEELKAIAIDISMLYAKPSDINELPNCAGDDRTLDKLIDGKQVTTDDHHMWMIPFTPGSAHLLTVTFPEARFVSCFRIWNYNKSRDDSYRGAKQVHVQLDGVTATPPSGIMLRKAPGEACFDFGQTVALSALSYVCEPKISKEIGIRREQRPREELRRQGYELAPLPCGFVFKFVFLSTWGDPFYIGLNGLELYDWKGERLPVSLDNAEAVPRSINVLPDVKNDPRTLDKLFDGVNDTFNDMHMWLCPFIPGQANYLYIFFDQPVALGMVKLWNYSKTPARGVEEFELLVDDVLAFKGFLRQAPTPSRAEPDFAQSIIFTNDDAMLARERRHLFSVQEEEQHVQFINNRQVMIPSSRRPSGTRSAKRPKTSVQGVDV